MQSQVIQQQNSSPLLLREWAPLTDLLNRIPLKSQNGLFSQDVKITSIDVIPEFVALGTNIGVVYWYDRLKKDLQRLQCEKQLIHIDVVKVISTVDYMVACGGRDGSINIFQIPKKHPDTIPENFKPKNKQIERYTVTDLHKVSVSAIEWAKNGMKLFSGDKNGVVVLTEIDFYMHICKSLEILNEAYQVVQLSYCNQRLLVSTLYRSIICQNLDKWKVCQVGKKDRKILGKFGGVICQSGKVNDVVLYCTRPGLRVWIADADGNVNNTLLFKNLLYKESSEVPIINPISRKLKMLKPLQEPSFGILLKFNDNLLLTYNNDIIYIFDPVKMAVISTMSQFRSVLSVATYKDEIFVLEEDRNIVRISYRPEISTTTNNDLSTISSDSCQDDVNIHTDTSMIMNAEEAMEFPLRRNNDSHRFEEIGRQEFHDRILHVRNNRKKHGNTASVMSLSSNSSDEMSIKPMLMMSLSSMGVLPDLRSPESIQSDIEYKEKILADLLDLDKVKINLNCDNNDGGGIEEEESTGPSDVLIISDCDNQAVAPSDSDIKKESPVVTPVCLDIPNDWKLADIQLNTDNNIQSDSSLTDWEVI